MDAVGLGFIIRAAYSLQSLVGFIVLSRWTLYRAAGRQARMQPFWLALVGGMGSQLASRHQSTRRI